MTKNHHSQSFLQSGFTLIEVLLVVAIIGVIAAFSAPIYQSLSNNNELDVALNVMIQDLYRAQSYSRNIADDKPWGVAINGQTITLFRGSSYATRDSAFDDNYLVPDVIQLTGSSQVLYAKLTGLPQSTASISLVAPIGTRVVTVNSKGLVDY